MAIVHFINRPKSQHTAGMLFVLRYTMQDKKTIAEDGIKYVTGINCTPKSAYAEFRNTKIMHGKTDGRQYYHFVQSFPVGEQITPDLAHDIALRLVSESKLFDGFEAVVSTHSDRDHVHSHFVLNSVNAETGVKFHIGENDIRELMKLSDQIVSEYGLSVLQPKPKEPMKGIGNNEMHALKKGESFKLELALAIDSCMKQARSKKHFIWLMEQEGYKVKWTEERKNITYTCPNGKRCCDDKLHNKKYLKEMMEREFRIRAEIIRGLQETSGTEQQECRTGCPGGDDSRKQLEINNCPQSDHDRLDGIPVTGTREFGYEGSDTESNATADQCNDTGEQSYSFRHEGYDRENENGSDFYSETGWEPEREECFVPDECQVGDDSFYEEALRDFDSGKLDIVIGGAYLAADLQNLIDDDRDRRRQDSTTINFGQRKRKDKDMSMGGM